MTEKKFYYLLSLDSYERLMRAILIMPDCAFDAEAREEYKLLSFLQD